MSDPMLLSKTRLEALTDGIFGVTMTLLVLDLKFTQGPPPPRNAYEDLAQLAARVDNYVISFIVLGVFWIGHVRLLRRARDADMTLTMLTLAFLLLTTFVPSLTSLLGDNPAAPRAALLYGGNLALILIVEMLAWRWVFMHLADDSVDNPQAMWNVVRRRHLVAMVVVIAGMATALVEIRIGASEGLAPWFYLALLAVGLMQPVLRGSGRSSDG